MQPTELTEIDRWAGVINQLSAKRVEAQQTLETLRTEKRELALEASLGSEPARQRSQLLSAEINRIALEIDEYGQAIQQASANKQTAQNQAAADAENQRQEKLTHLVRQYFNLVTKCDATCIKLVQQFQAAREKLQQCESKMNAQQRVPIQQLYSLWGATNAAAHHGLGKFLELGPSAGHLIHRKPLLGLCLVFRFGFCTNRRGIDEQHTTQGTDQWESNRHR
jgi:hypothetical protein